MDHNHIGLTVSVAEGDTLMSESTPLPTQISSNDFIKYFVKNSHKLLRAAKSNAKLNCSISNYFVQVSLDNITFTHVDGTQIIITKDHLDMLTAIGSICSLKTLFD